MATDGVELRRVQPDALTTDELTALTLLRNAVDPDIGPGDPPLTVAEVEADLSTENATFLKQDWVLWRHGQPVGVGRITMPNAGDNAATANLRIAVHPDHRRHGFGQLLLNELLAVAASQGRTDVRAWAELDEPTSAFFAALGWEMAFDERISRLDVDAVDATQMARWVNRASERAGDYHLERWIGPCPDHLLDAFVIALGGLADAPAEGLDIEPAKWTPERARDGERSFMALGYELYTIMALETATGAPAGYTNVFVPKERPSHARQSDTATLAAHRNRGIGRWMKAAMWQWLRSERPEIAFIDTGNAESNAAMLAINVEMGFRPIHRIGAWQPVDDE